MNTQNNSINKDNLIKFKGIIKRISNNADDAGKTYFYIDSTVRNIPREKDNTIQCRSFRTGLMENMPVEVEGVCDKNGFDCTHWSFIWLDEKTTIEYYVSLTKSKNTGIGQRKIEKIIEKYGKEIVCMDDITMRQSLLQDFPKWNLEAIDKFIRAVFDTDTVLIELEQFLSQFPKFDYKTIVDIYEEYKQNSMRIVKTNPYIICLEYNIPMNIGDAVAYEVGLSAFNPCRINALIEHYLEQRGNSGHTYGYAKELNQKLNRFSERSIYKTPLPAILVSNAILNNQRFVLESDTGRIALKKLYNAEINIKNRLNVISKTAVSNISVKLETIKNIEKKFHVTYGADQRRAFYSLEDDGITVLTGGPGTGKTSVIKGIVEYYKLHHPHAVVKFAAPTGRAAKRLSESLDGYKAYTIDKLVGSKPFESGQMVQHNAANPLDIDFLIVDEMSMVGVSKLEMLLLALKDTTRILLVGDEFQLPSVDAGNCLHDIIKSNKFPVYRLTENFRQKGNGTIIDNANRILSGEMPDTNETDFHVIKCQNDTDGFETLKQIIKENYDNNNPFKTQVIEPSKKGPAGTYAVNEFVHKTLVHKDENTSSDIQPGDKIMFLRNQYIMNEESDEAEPLYVNGEICIVDYIDEDEIVVSDGYSDDVKVLPHSAVHDMTLAYSFTIHKSQGSENPVVIIYLPESTGNMMYRSLLYTAVTRARDSVIIIYTGDALMKCINNTDNAKRNTRLLERLSA